MIKLQNIAHDYGNKKALNNVNLEIKEGEIFGLIGHNGAGKSTTIKGIVSIIDHTEGNIFIDGKNIKEFRDECKNKIAYVPDSPDMFLRLQAMTYWNFISDVYGISEEDREKRINELCDIFSMSDVKEMFIEEFSHGMRQKTFLIGALIPNPKIWILDEPMTGLDPQAAFNLKELMKKHVSEGNTVLFSTHVLEVAEKLCDRIGILKKGELIFVGTMEELRGDSTRNLEEIYLEMVSDKSDTEKSLEDPNLEKKENVR